MFFLTGGDCPALHDSKIQYECNSKIEIEIV